MANWFMYVTILAIWCGLTLVLCVWIGTRPELQFHTVIRRGKPEDDPVTESKDHSNFWINPLLWVGLTATLALVAWSCRDDLIGMLWIVSACLAMFVFSHVRAWNTDREVWRITRLRDTAGLDASIVEARRLIETKGDTPYRRYSLGSLYIDKEDWQAALDELDAAVAGDTESNRHAHVARGVPLWHLDRREEAEPLLIEDLKLNRWDAKAYIRYAHLMAEAGRFDETRRVMPSAETLWKLRPLSEFDRERLGRMVDDVRHWLSEETTE